MDEEAVEVDGSQHAVLASAQGTCGLAQTRSASS